MGKRRDLSIEEILQSESRTKQHYKNILFLLYTTKGRKVRLMHLRYLFIKNHDNIQEFNSKGKRTSLSKSLEKGLGLTFQRADVVTAELIWSFISKPYKIEGNNLLVYYLNELRKLGLIYKYRVEGKVHGYYEKTPYYMILDQGEDEVRKMAIHSIINEMWGDDLESLLDIIYQYRMLHPPKKQKENPPSNKEKSAEIIANQPTAKEIRELIQQSRHGQTLAKMAKAYGHREKKLQAKLSQIESASEDNET